MPAPTSTGLPPVACTPDTRPPRAPAGLAERSKGVDALTSGKPQDALQAFEKVMELNPSDVAAFTLHVAANADIAAERERAGRVFGRVKPIKIETSAPPHKTLVQASKAPIPSLKKLAEEANAGDWLSWMIEKNLHNPIGNVGDGQLPTFFGAQFGDTPMYAAYLGEGYDVARYGPALLILGEQSKGMRAIQLEPLLLSAFEKQTQGATPETIFPEVRIVEIVGSTLIAQLAHEGDGQGVTPDGIVVAIDLEHDKLLWISDEKTGNSYTTYATGTHFVTAFTDPTSGGKINVLDVATGDVVASEPVPYRVDYVVGSGTKVWAWGYEKTMSLELSSAPARSAARLGKLSREESAVTSALDPGRACLVKNAVVALDYRDGPAVALITDQLSEESNTTKVLRAASEFLVARAKGTAGIDLTEKSPMPVQFVPNALLRKDGPKPTGSPKRFIAAKDPIEEPVKPPFMEAPTPLYSTTRLDIYPMRYGIWNIEGGYSYGDDVILVYERRFIVTIRDNQVINIVDMKPLLGDKSKELGNVPAAYFVTVLRGVVYALVTPPQPSTPNTAATGYVVALDPVSGKILWRTDNGLFARTFVVFGEYMLVGRNRDKTSELSLLRMSDGETVRTQKLKQPLNDFGWDPRGLVYAGLPAKREYFNLKP